MTSFGVNCIKIADFRSKTGFVKGELRSFSIFHYVLEKHGFAFIDFNHLVSIFLATNKNTNKAYILLHFKLKIQTPHPRPASCIHSLVWWSHTYPNRDAFLAGRLLRNSFITTRLYLISPARRFSFFLYLT